MKKILCSLVIGTSLFGTLENKCFDNRVYAQSPTGISNPTNMPSTNYLLNPSNPSSITNPLNPLNPLSPNYPTNYDRSKSDKPNHSEELFSAGDAKKIIGLWALGFTGLLGLMGHGIYKDIKSKAPKNNSN